MTDEKLDQILKQALAPPEYSVSDKGITLTASEIYCDGYSIFLTVNIQDDDADFTHIPEHYTGMQAAEYKTAAGFYIGGTWRYDGCRNV